MMSGFQREVVPYLLPYTTEWDEKAWAVSQIKLWFYAYLYVRDSTILLPFGVIDTEHGEYPSDKVVYLSGLAEYIKRLEKYKCISTGIGPT
eukprot:UN34085